MLQTPLCHQIGIAYPIFSVGMGPVAGPELAAAVSNAGGCGVLGGVLKPAPYLQQEIQRLHTLTDKPFGGNLILPLLQEGEIDACLFDHGGPVYNGGDAYEYLSRPCPDCLGRIAAANTLPARASSGGVVRPQRL